MDVPAVCNHGILTLGDAAQERKADIKDGHAEDQERHSKGNDGVHFEKARDGERRHDVAEESRAGVSHEDLGGIEVERQKADTGTVPAAISAADGRGSRTAMSATAAAISACIATIHQRLLRNMSTNGLHSGLIVHGRYSRLV